MYFAERLRLRIASLRKERRLTQSALASQLGLSAQAVSKWERGQSTPDMALIMDLCAILGTTADSLLGPHSKLMRVAPEIPVADMDEAVRYYEQQLGF
jgi:transcriptional regulator with XRE-family HTH domain